VPKGCWKWSGFVATEEGVAWTWVVQGLAARAEPLPCHSLACEGSHPLPSGQGERDGIVQELDEIKKDRPSSVYFSDCQAQVWLPQSFSPVSCSDNLNIGSFSSVSCSNTLDIGSFDWQENGFSLHITWKLRWTRFSWRFFHYKFLALPSCGKVS